MSVSEEIARLAQLRDQRILTEDEFQRQKDALLAGQKTPSTLLGKSAKGIGIGCLVLFGLAMMPAIITAVRGGPSDPPAGGAVAGGVGVTKAGFDRLRTGMTYQQVATILGEPGQEMSRSEVAGATTAMYQWQGVGSGNMNATFQNDRLVQKAQFGL